MGFYSCLIRQETGVESSVGTEEVVGVEVAAVGEGGGHLKCLWACTVARFV